MHRALGDRLLTVGSELLPAEAEKSPRLDARVALQPLLDQPRNGALRASYRPVQEQHTPLGAVAVRGALEDVDQVDHRPFQAINRIFAGVVGILEKLVPQQLLLVDSDLFSI